MIRINLLETAQKKKRRKRALPSGTAAVALFIVILLVEGLLLFYWSTVKNDTLTAQTQLTTEAQQKLDGFKKLKTEKEELQKKMTEEKQQADIFTQLHSNTIGPGNMLLFLSYMLTSPPLENHSERVVQEQIGWDTQWDPDRAWFTSLKEGKERDFVMTGSAVSQHDTDEVLRRLKSSIYFQGVTLESAKVSKAERDRPALIEFRIKGYLNYDENVGKEASKDAAPAAGNQKPAGGQG